MLDANIFLFEPTSLLLNSVRIGQVPVIDKFDFIKDERNVSHPVLTVLLVSFVSDCLNA